MTKLLHKIRTTRILPNLKTWTHKEYATFFLVMGVIQWCVIPVTIALREYLWLIPWLLANALGFWYIAYRVYTAGEVRDDG